MAKCPERYYSRVLGIDPGENPGYVYMCRNNNGKLVVEHATSCFESLLLACPDLSDTIDAVMCEGQWIGPYQRSSVLTLARTAGYQAWRAATDRPHYFLQPQLWRKAIGCANTKQAAADVVSKNGWLIDFTSDNIVDACGIAAAGLLLSVSALDKYLAIKPK